MKKEPEKEKPKEEISGQQISGIPGGININLSNSQNIQPQVEQYGPVVYGDGELHVVNKVAYVLFAIFLGNIGVHKFLQVIRDKVFYIYYFAGHGFPA